jgi:hypothetical protein
MIARTNTRLSFAPTMAPTLGLYDRGERAALQDRENVTFTKKLQAYFENIT